MRILFLGDVMGRSGRDAVAVHLPMLKEKLRPDVVIVNGENAAAGHGITVKIAQDFYAMGVDCLTTGNHVWNQKEMLSAIDGDPRLLRPRNFPDGTPGRGAYIYTLPDGRKILVANIMGNLYMDQSLDNPFAAADRIAFAHKLGQGVQAIFIDFHAEATSEKMALAQYMDGRVTAVIGTHTHIPTADEQVLPAGTAFQCDAGMCGDFDSVIGMKKERSIWRFTRKTPGERMEPAEAEATICGCFIVTNDKTGLAQSINAVRVGGRLKQAVPDV